MKSRRVKCVPCQSKDEHHRITHHMLCVPANLSTTMDPNVVPNHLPEDDQGGKVPLHQQHHSLETLIDAVTLSCTPGLWCPSTRESQFGLMC